MKLPVPPRNPTSAIPVPDGAPALPAVVGVIGARGQGKSHVTAQLIKSFVDHGSIDRVFIISPTYHTNSHLWAWTGASPHDCFTAIHQAEDALKEIVRRIQAQKAQWSTRQEYEEAVEAHRSRRTLTMKQRSFLENTPPPKVDLPRPAVILDDLSHSKVMNSKYLINLTLRSRHVAHNPQIGLSMFFLVQSLKAGIPRTLRSNVSAWLVFGTKDQSIVDDLHSELSGKIGKQEFTSLFHSATEAPHSYLVVDLTTRDPTRVFRQGL
jgi:hypothetical protein